MYRKVKSDHSLGECVLPYHMLYLYQSILIENYHSLPIAIDKDILETERISWQPSEWEVLKPVRSLSIVKQQRFCDTRKALIGF